MLKIGIKFLYFYKQGVKYKKQKLKKNEKESPLAQKLRGIGLSIPLGEGVSIDRPKPHFCTVALRLQICRNANGKRPKIGKCKRGDDE